MAKSKKPQESVEKTEQAPGVEVSKEVVLATKADIDGLRDAVQELTKVIGENTKENIKWFRAGKMG